MTKSESTADILRRIAKRERIIEVRIGDDLIELVRPEAQEYQRLLGLAAEVGDGNDLAKSVDLYAEVLAAAVDGLTVDDAREAIIGVGIDSPLAKACMRILGTSSPDLDDPAGKSSA